MRKARRCFLWLRAHVQIAFYDFVTMTEAERQNLTTKGLTFNKWETQPFRAALVKAACFADIKKTAGDRA